MALFKRSCSNLRKAPCKSERSQESLGFWILLPLFLGFFRLRTVSFFPLFSFRPLETFRPSRSFAMHTLKRPGTFPESLSLNELFGALICCSRGTVAAKARGFSLEILLLLVRHLLLLAWHLLLLAWHLFLIAFRFEILWTSFSFSLFFSSDHFCRSCDSLFRKAPA